MPDLSYPNLASCKITVANASGTSKPPVRLPAECRSAAEMKLPPLYDFALEKSILEKKAEREQEAQQKGSSKEALEQAVLVKMKSVTGASDDVCVAMLEQNGYDLKESVEAFFQK